MFKKCLTLNKNLLNTFKVSAAAANYSSDVASHVTKDYKLHKITDGGPSTTVQVNKNDALNYFKQMTLIRKFESAAGTLYKEKLVRGFCHLYNGQEAVAVGMKAALRPGDDVITSYRCHAWAYLQGISVPSLLCELVGHIEGNVRGKGGSMHLYCENFFGGNGIVGAQVPLGAGLAFAQKYRGKNGVCLAIYGDGASNQGQIFETYDMAALWKIPVIFVCENNLYGMGTSIERSSASTDYYARGDFVPGIWVDGMDVFAVREATRYAVEHASSGKGPISIEAVTYRYVGHSMSDPGTSYRSREEVQEVRATRDAIHHLKDKILECGWATNQELKDIEHNIKVEVDKAANKARTDAGIKLEELTWDIYSKDDNLKQVRNILPNTELPHKRFNTAVNFN